MTNTDVVIVMVAGEEMKLRIPSGDDYEALVRSNDIGCRLFEILPEDEATELLHSLLLVLRKRFADLNPDPLDRIIEVAAHDRLHEFHRRVAAAEAEAAELRKQLSSALNRLEQCKVFLRSLRDLAKTYDVRGAVKVLHGFRPNQDPKWQAADRLNQFCAEFRCRAQDQIPALLEQ